MPISDTESQELTSAWIFRRALNDNVRYKSTDDILLDPKFQEEVIGTTRKPGIYPDIDKVWLNNYFVQQKKFLDEFSNAKFSEFSRKGGFMDFISNLVNRKFGISNTDTWNPTDIWCVKEERKVISDINAVVESGQLDSVEQLNALLRTMYKERRVVGISLKLVKRDQAYFEEFNVEDDLQFISSKTPTVTVIETNLDANVKVCEITDILDKYKKDRGFII
jgi:hypothetical protein